ncbi:Gfo/Idh/MocA family protein [Agromyces sp. GXQ0307]|uniref:Gfo/Idh/MocA family protein n=1 Tax=Agromyces sp. GXQ0307 TaxID=3377835 RepID=UPI00383A1A1C
MTYQRDFDRRVRLGVVGVGSHSYRNLLPTLTYLPADLVAIADLDRELGDATARQYGLQRSYRSAAEMYAAEELDAVLLCVSPQLHPQLAREAFAAGLHVWLEKPVGTSVADVDSMIAAQGDRIAVVGYKKVFMPAATKARELLALDEFGPLHTMSGIYPMNIPRGDDESIARGGKNRWLIDGCHPTALLLSLAGPAAQVAVHRADDDSGVLVIRHESGTVTSLHLADSAPAFQPVERYFMVGQGRSVEIRNSRSITYQRGIPFSYATGTTFAPEGLDSGGITWEAQDGMNTLENKAVFTQGMYGELKYFLDCVLAGRPAEVSGLAFARQVMQVFEAAVRSDGDLVDITKEKE